MGAVICVLLLLLLSFFITPDGSTKTNTQQYKNENIHKAQKNN